MMSKSGRLMLPGAFPGKVTLDTDKAKVQCDFPVVRILL